MAAASVFLSCRHSIQDRKYRSKGLLGGYFGIRTPPAGLAQTAFTEVLACLAATSVFARRRQGLLKLHLPKFWLVWRLLRYSHAADRACSSCIYRSIGLFGGYFGIRTTPTGQTHAAFTEVLACLAATSVFLSSRHSIQDRDYRSNRVFALYFRNLVTQLLPRLPLLRKYSLFFSPFP